MITGICIMCTHGMFIDKVGVGRLYLISLFESLIFLSVFLVGFTFSFLVEGEILIYNGPVWLADMSFVLWSISIFGFAVTAALGDIQKRRLKRYT